MLAPIFTERSVWGIKLLAFFWLMVFIHLGNEACGQVTLNEKNAPLTRVIKSIEEQSGYLFIYDESKVKLGRVTVELKNASIYETLAKCFRNAPVAYVIIEKNIVLKSKRETTAVVDSISGKVVDEKGEGLAGATVFLNDSRQTVVSDNNGGFSLSPIQPGTYELVVKMVGYAPATNNITVSNESVNTLIKMKIDTIMLHGVIIKANPAPNRTRYLNLFKKNFIGISPNASECQILNPDDIYLSYDEKDDILNAQSTEFIKIENRALGYKVNYLINNFELNTKTNVSSINVKPFFEELTGTKEDRKKWEANRKLAYEGSIRHFFKTLFNNTTKAEGFLVYQIPESSVKQDLSTIQPISTDTIFSVIDKNFRLFKLQPASANSKDTSRIYIVYIKSKEPSAFYNFSPDHIELPVKLKNKKSQVSELVLYTNDVLFDKNGNLAPVNKSLFLGYWSLERAADLMPLDYPTAMIKPK